MNDGVARTELESALLRHVGAEKFAAIMTARAGDGTPQQRWERECVAALGAKAFDALPHDLRRRLLSRYDFDERTKSELAASGIKKFMALSENAGRHICRHCHKIYRSRFSQTCSSACYEAVGSDSVCGACGRSFINAFHGLGKERCPGTCACGQLEQCEDRIAHGDFRT